jgi:AcrR family transcriptional regulator
MSSRSLLSATCPVPPTTDPIGPATHQAQAEPVASPWLYRALRRDPQNQTTRLLLETERLLRLYGHRKITLAEVADACGFSAANIYRYFSSRRAILDTLAYHYLQEAQRTALARAIRSESARDRLSSFLTGLNETLIVFSRSEPRLGELLADAAAEQWPCCSRYDALVVGHIAKILAEGSASGEFRLEDDAEQEARRVKAAACALLEPDVIRLCRDKHDVRTREALSRLIAAALLVRSVPRCCASPQG